MVQNSGSFGSVLGGGEFLKAAMQRRGIDTGVLDQMSPAVGGSPVSPDVPQGAPNIGPSPSQVMTDQTPQAQPGASSRSAEMDIALKALAGTVKTENKIAEATLAPKPIMGV